MFVPFFITILISSVAAQSGHPEFDKEVEQVVLQEGALEKVDCIAKGELPLTYLWYDKHDAEIITDVNNGIFARRTEEGSSLIFAKAKVSHAGLYSCSATNKHGTATKSYDIIVNSTSGNITTNETAEIVSVEVTNITDNSVEFDVQITGSPKSFYIRYEEEVLKGENWTEIKTGDRTLVKDLVPGGRYQFRFQIEPPSRVKIPSTPHEVIMLPGVPDVIFRNIENGFVDIEWFRSMDEFFRKTIEEYELSYQYVRQVGGRTWETDDCSIIIKIPNRYCTRSKYIIAGLEKRSYYEISLRMRTASGYGRPYVNKVYML